MVGEVEEVEEVEEEVEAKEAEEAEGGREEAAEAAEGGGTTNSRRAGSARSPARPLPSPRRRRAFAVTAAVCLTSPGVNTCTDGGSRSRSPRTSCRGRSSIAWASRI